MDPHLSRTFQSLTRSKIHELEKQRNIYESRKAETLETASKCPTLRERVAQLVVGTKKLSQGAESDSEIANIEHWVEQARFDASIPSEKLEGFETHLRDRLDAYSRKLNLADLYSRLLTEWMNPRSKHEDVANHPSEDEDFEIVDERQKERLKQLCDQFEDMVFKPYETSPAEITSFLQGLFPGADGVKSLESLRSKISVESQSIWDQKDPFTVDSLSRCIRGIRNEEIISEQKQQTLKHFLDNKVALNEIADVLNMRYADLRNWDWHADSEGVPVLPRQQLNGKYRIWMDEDVLETIFVEHICIRICQMLKNTLKGFIEDKQSVWDVPMKPKMTRQDRLRRRYYCGEQRSDSLEACRKAEFENDFFLTALPDDEGTGWNYDDGDEHNLEQRRKSVKQMLLRKVVTETLLARHLHGEAVVIQSDLRWYATSIPHSTVYTILEFIGFSEDWVEFFRKYLETPLNMDKSFEGHDQLGPRKRRRGIPIAHASEKTIGELILFFMDLAVRRETGVLLYRLHDDIWLSGEPQKCAQSWEAMQRFANITGLTFNKSKTGSVYLSNSIDPAIASRLPNESVKIGFLMLDPSSGDWVIDHSQVQTHINQLKRQLDQCNSLLSWIRTWNSCIGRFFKNTFGEPAFCFGRPHIDAILTSYEEMHKTIFGTKTNNTYCGGTLTEYLRNEIASRFGVSDIPDAFFFLPEKLGGLGVRNPFVSIFPLRQHLLKSGQELVETFLRLELAEYDMAKKEFVKMTPRQRVRRLGNLKSENSSEEDEIVSSEEMHTFMTFAEWTRFRDETSSSLTALYRRLMDTPSHNSPCTTEKVESALRKAQNKFGLHYIDAEFKWILYMYADDLLTKFGGLNLVDKQFLPTGVLDMIKEKKVTWQMAL
ncbi:reverse transcriptase [Penicillium canariense]|uniref:Reverse transcriptase n=1 Tax=Penicillium canariense TaxID=189055 RepID=A0A9W9LG36_9EURO|nr:reverse transcriptase [Penicillium canariense]KAJ5152992.1 reverse transcriptase [Penicillium canariense]